MATKNAAEQAVRDYLQFRADPSALVNTEAVAEIQKELDGTTDPIEQLRLHTQLDAASKVDREPYEAAFIEHAKAWAEANDVDVRAFREVHGVPTDVLNKAGFTVPRKSSGKRVRKADVIAKVPAKGTLFTISELQTASEASPVTVRQTVNALVDEGVVVNHGPDPDFDGQGKAPFRYERV